MLHWNCAAKWHPWLKWIQEENIFQLLIHSKTRQRHGAHERKNMPKSSSWFTSGRLRLLHDQTRRRLPVSPPQHYLHSNRANWDNSSLHAAPTMIDGTALTHFRICNGSVLWVAIALLPYSHVHTHMRTDHDRMPSTMTLACGLCAWQPTKDFTSKPATIAAIVARLFVLCVSERPWTRSRFLAIVFALVFNSTKHTACNPSSS